MEDLSLHILDIVQNSISAMANLVEIMIVEDKEKNWLTIKIKDNGRGMEPAMIDRVTDPFYTTRTTRKVGLGLPLFRAAAEGCGGGFHITSQSGIGTCIEAEFQLDHIDRPPFGNLVDTMITLILCNLEVDFLYNHQTLRGTFRLDTREIREKVGDIPLVHSEIIQWIRSYIMEGLNEIDGGVE